MLKNCGVVVVVGGWPTGFYCQPKAPLGLIRFWNLLELGWGWD